MADRKATRKATPPRKAAARKAPAKRAAKAVPIEIPDLNGQRPPEPFPPTPESGQAAPKPAVPDHPYGNVPVYIFHPKVVRPGDSMDPIVFPAITTINADVEFFWELDEMDPMHQAFRYMKKANVPREVQRRVVRLPETEAARFLNGWFKGVLLPEGVEPPGES